MLLRPFHALSSRSSLDSILLMARVLILNLYAYCSRIKKEFPHKKKLSTLLQLRNFVVQPIIHQKTRFYTECIFRE